MWNKSDCFSTWANCNLRKISKLGKWPQMVHDVSTFTQPPSWLSSFLSPCNPPEEGRVRIPEVVFVCLFVAYGRTQDGQDSPNRVLSTVLKHTENELKCTIVNRWLDQRFSDGGWQPPRGSRASFQGNQFTSFFCWTDKPLFSGVSETHIACVLDFHDLHQRTSLKKCRQSDIFLQVSFNPV